MDRLFVASDATPALDGEVRGDSYTIFVLDKKSRVLWFVQKTV